MARVRLGEIGPYAGQIRDSRSNVRGRVVTGVNGSPSMNSLDLIRIDQSANLGTTSKSVLAPRPHRGITMPGQQASDLWSPLN